MISLKTVCLLYFALLFGLTHAQQQIKPGDGGTNAQNSTSPGANTANAQNTHTTTSNGKNSQDRNNTAPNDAPNDIKRKKNQTTVHPCCDNTSSSSSSLASSNSPKAASQPSVCTSATTEPSEYQCIFSLPSGDKLHLIVAVLIVGCLVLLMTTLMCACQVCHLKGLISGLHSRHDNIDLRAIREKSETPQKNEERVDRHPTETCLLLSEVTTGQEESKELEVKIAEVKVEEMEQIGTEMPVMDPNGDINQENSIMPEEKQPESSDKPEV